MSGTRWIQGGCSRTLLLSFGPVSATVCVSVVVPSLPSTQLFASSAKCRAVRKRKCSCCQEQRRGANF